jgi:hypothetical protein
MGNKLRSTSRINKQIMFKKMNITDLKITIGAIMSIGLNVSDFNVGIATISGIVFLGYGISRWYYLIKNKGK